ncbi:MAG: hypothetical protein V7L09_13335 [Nostoc sp.]|uniref:hypothetical protein n=1 Tax=Nostoc sp. TaxID=1180 RepID=UPI002FEE9D87
MIVGMNVYISLTLSTAEDFTYTNSINDCNRSLGKDAMNRVSTNDLFVAFFFQISITRFLRSHNHHNDQN